MGIPRVLLVLSFLRAVLELHLLLLPQTTLAGMLVEPILQPGFSHADIIPGVIVVKLKSTPAIQGGRAADMVTERRAFFGDLRRARVSYRTRHVYQGVFNGASLQVDDPGQIHAIAALDSVERVYYSRVIRRPTAHFQSLASAQGNGYDLFTGELKPEHNITGVYQVQRVLNITGRGIKVGIIDSGIDYTHPALGGCSAIGSGCRVAFGYDFVGDLYDGASWNATVNTPRPDPDPMDCDGHGTHVAGIVGAKDGKFVGVAPEVTLGAYRVFGCSGSVGDDVLLASLDRAWADGMDVINLSLGGEAFWPEGDLLSSAVTALANKGVLVTAANGNSGELGQWTASTPGMADGIMGVGSTDNDQYVAAGTLRESRSSKIIPFTMVPAQIPLLRNGTLVVSSTSGCDAYNASDRAAIQGKIVLVQRGVCTFETKALTAQAAGAIAVIIYNRVSGPWGNAASKDIKIAVGTVSLANGEFLINRSRLGPVHIKWLPGAMLQRVANGGKMSSFSSWGPTPNLNIKPDYAAPGSLIFSTIPVKDGSYAIFSGTSMSTPYAAGVAALYLSSRGNWTNTTIASEARQALQNNAKPVFHLGSRLRTPVAQQGAGLINALQAILGLTTATPSTLELKVLPVSPTTLTRTITISNRGTSDVTYSFAHVPALSVNCTSTNRVIPPLSNRISKVTFSRGTARIAAGKTANVTVTISLDFLQPAGELWMYSGYVRVQQTAVLSNPNYTTVFVPYLGFRGEAAAFRALAGGNKSPYVMSSKDYGTPGAPRYTLENETATFTFDSTTWDIPVFFYTIDRPMVSLSLMLFNFSTDAIIGSIYFPYTEFLMPGDWYAEWVYPAGNRPYVLRSKEWVPVPNGEYYVILSVTNAVRGVDPAWRSPKIVVNAA